MALTRSITRPVFAGLFGAVEGEASVTRNLIKLNPSLQQYFTFAPQEESGAFEIQVDFCVIATGSFYGVMGEYTNGNGFERSGSIYIYQNKATVRKSLNSNSSVSISTGVFNTLNLKRVGSTVTYTLNGTVEDSWQHYRHPGSTTGYIYNQIGIFLNSLEFDGYIKDVHLISGFPQNKFFKLDETLVGSSAIVDSNGGSAGVMVNGGSAYSEPFTLNTAVSPNVWVNNSGSISLPVVGT